MCLEPFLPLDDVCDGGAESLPDSACAGDACDAAGVPGLEDLW